MSIKYSDIIEKLPNRSSDDDDSGHFRDVILRQKGYTSAQSKAKAQITLGVSLYGYCCGYFGRDSYDVKTVVSVVGDTIVAVDDRGRTVTSHPITDWVDLIRSSNAALDEERYEEESEE